jgi:predicted PurR-regulated permease PerM
MSAPPPPPIANPWRESARVLGRYVRGQILIAAAVTGLYLVGFLLIRLPYWFPVALVCGVLNLVPRLGSLLALGLVLLVGWLGSPDWWRWIMALAVWVIVQGLEGFVLTPHFLGRPLGLRPMVTFLAVLLGSLLFGPLGFFLAVPALAVGQVFWRYWRDRRPGRP